MFYHSSMIQFTIILGEIYRKKEQLHKNSSMMQNKFKMYMKLHMTNIKVSVSVGEILQKEVR